MIRYCIIRNANKSYQLEKLYDTRYTLYIEEKQIRNIKHDVLLLFVRRSRRIRIWQMNIHKYTLLTNLEDFVYFCFCNNRGTTVCVAMAL